MRLACQSLGRTGAEIIPLPSAGLAAFSAPSPVDDVGQPSAFARRVQVFETGVLVLDGTGAAESSIPAREPVEFTIRLEMPGGHGLCGLVDPSATRLMEAARSGLRVRGATAVGVGRHLQALVSRRGLARVAVFFQLFAEMAAAPAHEVQPETTAHRLRSYCVRREEMMRAVHYIRANYRDAIGLTELLRLTHMSRASFARQFRCHTGRTFSQLLNHVRLEAVCRDLRETAEPVGNIAFAHGFNQLSFFNRLFRRETGLSPSRYRARHRAEEFAAGLRNAVAS